MWACGSVEFIDKDYVADNLLKKESERVFFSVTE